MRTISTAPFGAGFFVAWGSNYEDDVRSTAGSGRVAFGRVIAMVTAGISALLLVLAWLAGSLPLWMRIASASAATAAVPVLFLIRRHPSYHQYYFVKKTGETFRWYLTTRPSPEDAGNVNVKHSGWMRLDFSDLPEEVRAEIGRVSPETLLLVK